MSKHGAGFTAERLPDNKQRLSIVCADGILDENKLNAYLLFLESGVEPETLLGLQNLMFQAWAEDRMSDFSPQQIEGLECVMQLLTRLWACERRAAGKVQRVL